MPPVTATFAPSPAVVSPAAPTTALALANVLYEKKDAIAYVTVNRPKVLNALNTPTWKDLRTAFEAARDDGAVRGVVLTGAGDKAFVAGADISELAHVAAFEAEQASRFGQEVLDLIENLGKPVVAAVNGFALGGGCETAMACTIRIPVDTAKFGQPEVALGLLPGGGGTQRLPRLVGKGRALQLILSGEMIDAQEAVVTPDKFPALATGIGRPDLVTDPRFSDPAKQATNAAQLRAILDDVFAKEPMQHWRHVFDKAHITYGAILDPTEVVNDPQLRANNIVVPLEGAGGKLTLTISSPMQVHGVAKEPARRAPGLGEHNDEILRQLGFDVTQIEKLHAGGTVPRAKVRAA